jgi:hypothetical protein
MKLWKRLDVATASMARCRLALLHCIQIPPHVIHSCHNPKIKTLAGQRAPQNSPDIASSQFSGSKYVKEWSSLLSEDQSARTASSAAVTLLWPEWSVPATAAAPADMASQEQVKQQR